MKLYENDVVFTLGVLWRCTVARGIIYLMTTVVPGLIKIGKTGLNNFEQRMYQLEHNGYSNVTALKRSFAIEVDGYDEKEAMLHTIFAKSRVGDTELFALDVNIAKQLLSSFDGVVVYPKTESKNEIFNVATDNYSGKVIPDGIYEFKKKKKSDNRYVDAKAKIISGKWILLKDSVLGVTEDVGVSQRARVVRTTLPLDSNGVLLEDFDLGECSPSFAGTVVMNQSNNGWTDWKKGNDPVDIYRRKPIEELGDL